jgi:hypothetical protein
MLVDEADAPQSEAPCCPDGNIGLTNSAADLSWYGNDDTNSQGNYDYQAHAHVLPGGADPLGSQGYASVVENILPALRRGPRSQKLAGVFVYGRIFHGRLDEKIWTRKR